MRFFKGSLCSKMIRTGQITNNPTQEKIEKGKDHIMWAACPISCRILSGKHVFFCFFFLHLCIKGISMAIRLPFGCSMDV